MKTAAAVAFGFGRKLLGYILFLIVAVLIWTAYVRLAHIPAYVIPEPRAALLALVGARASILSHLAFTLQGALLGLLISIVLSLVLAATFAVSSSIADAAMPVLIVLRTIPVVAVAPLMIMMVGRTLWTSVVVVIIVSFFPILVNATRGFMAVPQSGLELMHVAGARWWHTLIKLRLPLALPFIFTGVRIASSAAILGAMLAEWLSGAPGLGFLILDSAAMQNAAQLWAVTLVSMTTGFLVFCITASVEQALAAWQD